MEWAEARVVTGGRPTLRGAEVEVTEVEVTEVAGTEVAGTEAGDSCEG